MVEKCEGDVVSTINKLDRYEFDVKEIK